MARNYRNRFRRYGNRVRSYGRRFYTGARSYGRRFYGGVRRYGGAAYRGVRRYQTRANRGFGPSGFKVYPDLPLAAGFAVGVTNLDRQIPPEITLAGAAAPIGGKYGRSVRNFFGGVIFGELFTRLTGKSINIPATTKTKSVADFYA